MSLNIAEGEVIAGKYRVERVLGRGGMGVVVAATHLGLDHKVAIKLLLPGATADVVARFAREARASVRLKSEHVARVLDVGELTDGAPYMVMEYLEGQDLSKVLKSRGPLPIDEAVQHVLHACEAIAEAHALGIIHRDLKPANLLLTHAADGTSTVKVLDFGISKTLDAATGPEGEGLSLTATTAVLGSPLFMSPEQMKASRNVDARSDLWSLGTILYQLIAGRAPWQGHAFAQLVMMVNLDEPPPLSSHRPDVPPELEAAILRCLEKKPENRFQNAAELAMAIAPFGPEGARASAERAARTLEMNGIPTTGLRSVRSLIPPALGEAATGPSSTGPSSAHIASASGAHATSRSSTAPSSGAPSPSSTAASAPGLATDARPSAPPRRSDPAITALSSASPTPSLASPARSPLVRIGVVLALALGVIAIVLALRPRDPEPSAAAPSALPAAASTTPVAAATAPSAAPIVAARPTMEPTVNAAPTDAIATPPPAASASAHAKPTAAPKQAPAAVPPPPTTGRRNPLDIQIK